MSDTDDDWPDEYIEVPPMDTQEGRDAAIELLMQDGELPCQCSVIQTDQDMVMRVRYPDGSEEVFDLVVRREMEVVRKSPEGEPN